MAVNAGNGPRFGFVLFAVFLSCAAVGIEMAASLCASVFFDPLPDAISLAAYAALPVTLLYNWWTLRGGVSEARNRRGRLVLALVLTSAALAVAGAYTVLFLPMMPVGAIAVVAYGLGLCVFSPVINLVLLIRQYLALRVRWREVDPTYERSVTAATVAAAAVAAFLVVGRPVLIGFWYQQVLNTQPREASLGWLRALGAEGTILELGYRGKTPVWISAGRFLAGRGNPAPPADNDNFVVRDNDMSAARRVYFLLTGRPYETAPRDLLFSRRDSWDNWNPVTSEQGGELVGHAVAGLELHSSRIDGVLDPASETAYCEWTMEFANDTGVPAEARTELLLPDGGVIDKVSLWINGEERPAAFGPRSVVQAAYREVAVVQRRDPLLVTQKQPGRALAQCFPVPANGKMKIRIGMSAPLVWTEQGGPRLTFGVPGLQQANFKIPETLRHEVWLEGRWAGDWQPVGAGWNFSAGTEGGKPVKTARVALQGGEIFRPPLLSLTTRRAPAAGDRPAPELARERSPLERPARPVDLLVVVDTSLSMKEVLGGNGRRPELVQALEALPNNSRIRMVDGRQLTSRQEPQASDWMEASGSRIEGWLAPRSFTGGTEPAGALRWALDQALDSRNPAAVVWLHGAVPSELSETSTLSQFFDRRPGGPVLVSVQLRPGPNALLDELAGYRRVFDVADRAGGESIRAAVELAHRAATTEETAGRLPLGGREPALNGLYAAAGTSPQNRIAHRLAVQSQVLAPWYAGKREGNEIDAAQKLAIKTRLVTPLSGAVVLETKAQYDRHNLSDAADASSIPSVPEPGTLALLAVAGGLGAVARFRRFRGARGRNAKGAENAENAKEELGSASEGR